MESDVLVSAQWLQEHLNDPGIRILDARVADPRLPIGYRRGHVPKAIPFDLGHDVYDVSGALPKMKSAEVIGHLLGALGISNNATVVVYDEGTGPLAAFTYWLLKYLGHREVRVLNGGWHTWQQSGCPTTRDVPDFDPESYVPRIDDLQRATADWIQEHSSRPDIALLDARTDGEHIMGHIPGSVNLSYDAALDYGTQGLKDQSELRGQFESIGITPDKEIVTYCGSGSRSAHTFLVLKSLGYPRVRNYDGSMMDWGRVRQLPIE